MNTILSDKISDKMIFFVDLDNTVCESPYPHIFDKIIHDISDNTRKSSEHVWLMINKEFKNREKKNAISAFDWDNILSQVCKKLGKEWDDSLRTYIDMHINKHGINVFKSVKSILLFLRSKNCKIYLTSNGYFFYQEPIIKATGLLSLFDDFITSDRVGYTKSSKQFYEEKIIDDDKVISIGDSYKYEILYPNIFGFYTIWDAETILPKFIKEKYLNITHVDRPLAMYNDLLKFSKSQENNIYLQDCKFTKLPDSIIFNFSEIGSLLSNNY